MRPPCMVLHKGPTKKNNILKTENLLIPYTHANNSSRVCMWGFAKKNCSLSLDGGFFYTIVQEDSTMKISIVSTMHLTSFYIDSATFHINKGMLNEQPKDCTYHILLTVF